MGKFIKYFFVVLSALITLFIAAIITLALTINPNDFKPQISNAVYEATQQELTLAGDIHWSFYPWLGIEAEDITLANPSGFNENDFVSIEKMGIEIRLIPLITGKLETGKAYLNGLKLNLIKNEKGQANWENLQQTTAENTSQTLTSTHENLPQISQANVATNTSKNSRMMLDFSISSIEINNAQINWSDLTTDQQTSLTDLTLTSNNIKLNQAFPVSLSFNLINSAPALKEKISLTANVTFTELALEVNDLTLMLEPENFPKDISKLSGSTSFDQQGIKFDLDIDQLNLDRHLDTSKNATSSSNIPSANTTVTLPANGDSSKDDDELFPTALLRELQLDGQLKIGSFTIANMTVTEITIPLTIDEGLVTLKPIKATIYQGELEGTINLDAKPKIPTLKVTQQLTGVSLAPLTARFSDNQFMQASGTANATLDLTSEGSSQAILLRNLNGNVAFDMHDGELAGIDFLYQIRRAGALAKHSDEATEGKEGEATPFTKISGSGTFRNGVMHTNDLILDSVLMKLEGQGTINLVSEQINLTLPTSLTDDGRKLVFGAIPANKPIPLFLTGTFSDPKPGIDVSKLLTETFADQIQRQLDRLLPGGGDITVTEEEPTNDPNKEDSLKQLEKGLKNLFGL